MIERYMQEVNVHSISSSPSPMVSSASSGIECPIPKHQVAPFNHLQLTPQVIQPRLTALQRTPIFDPRSSSTLIQNEDDKRRYLNEFQELLNNTHQRFDQRHTRHPLQMSGGAAGTLTVTRGIHGFNPRTDDRMSQNRPILNPNRIIFSHLGSSVI